MTPILKWSAGDFAASHELYFGMNEDAVANATKASPEYKGTKALGDEIYDPGKLAWYTTYYWRVDEVNNLNPKARGSATSGASRPVISLLWTTSRITMRREPNMVRHGLMVLAMALLELVYTILVTVRGLP